MPRPNLPFNGRRPRDQLTQRQLLPTVTMLPSSRYVDDNTAHTLRSS